jgi:hypothetical protein
MKTTTQADPKYLTIVHRSRGKQQGQKFLPAIFLGRWSKFELMASMLYLGQLRRRARDTEYARNGHRKGNDIRLLFAYRTKVRIEQVARHSIGSRINRAVSALVLKWLMPGRCTLYLVSFAQPLSLDHLGFHTPTRILGSLLADSLP